MNNRISTLERRASEIITETTLRLDEDRIREDLMGIIQDIRIELRNKSPEKENIIYEYAELLQKEIELYDPRMAFEAGAVLGCCDPMGPENNPDRAFTQYMLRIDYDPITLQIRRDLDNMHSEIYELLGETHGLLTDFIEEYRRCNGIISREILVFFEMGYELTHDHYLYVLGTAERVASGRGDTND